MARDRKGLPGVPGSEREDASPQSLPGVPGGQAAKPERLHRRAGRPIARIAVASARAARVVVSELAKGASAPVSEAPPAPPPGRTARTAANAPLVLAPRNDGIPVKQIAIVTCMDPRVNVLAALGLRNGDANVLRNAGGIVTDDVIRSLAVSQRVLGTREVIVVQHTDCRMQHIDGGAFRSELERAGGRPPPFDVGAFGDLDASVRASVRKVRDSRYLPHRDRVRGYVYDVGAHRLREVADH